MERTKRGVGWLAVVVLAAVVAAPVGAVAATTVVRIVGTSGSSADVSAAHRLLTAESGPRSYFSAGYFPVTGGGPCVQLFTASASQAVIVLQIVVRVKTNPAFDSSHAIVFALSPTCAGAFVFEDQPSSLGTEVFTLEPGKPVPAGGTFAAQAVGSGLTAEIQVTGYRVPAAAV
jgi:hypothetical protein